MSRAQLAAQLLVAWLLVAGSASAQTLWDADADRPQQLALSLALEPELVTSLRYAHRVGPADGRRRFMLGAGLKLPPLLVGHAAGRLELLAAVVHAPWHGVMASAMMLPYIARQQDDAATFVGLGAELRSFVGWAPSWGLLGADLGVQVTAATHIENSALLRRTFTDRYPAGSSSSIGPKDGWYRLTALRARIGASWLYRCDPRWTIGAALGTLFAYQEQGLWLAFNLAQLPFYLELTSRYAW